VGIGRAHQHRRQEEGGGQEEVNTHAHLLFDSKRTYERVNNKSATTTSFFVWHFIGCKPRTTILLTNGVLALNLAAWGGI
jgi:hypothetical protein